jgi:hypothetical protein
MKASTSANRTAPMSSSFHINFSAHSFPATDRHICEALRRKSHDISNDLTAPPFVTAGKEMQNSD